MPVEVVKVSGAAPDSVAEAAPEAVSAALVDAERDAVEARPEAEAGPDAVEAGPDADGVAVPGSAGDPVPAPGPQAVTVSSNTELSTRRAGGRRVVVDVIVGSLGGGGYAGGLSRLWQVTSGSGRNRRSGTHGGSGRPRLER